MEEGSLRIQALFLYQQTAFLCMLLFPSSDLMELMRKEEEYSEKGRRRRYSVEHKIWMDRQMCMYTHEPWAFHIRGPKSCGVL